MMFQGTVIKEQGLTFAVIVVKKSVIDNHFEANRAIRAFEEQVFGDMPVVLMAQDYRGVPIYYGRQDIARFMSNVPLSAIPWKEYTVSF
jgi:hypothetical protein